MEQEATVWDMIVNSNKHFESYIEEDKEGYISPKRRLRREKAQSRGFIDEYHQEGFLYFNRLHNINYNGNELQIYDDVFKSQENNDY